jgi:lysophospholipase L1-like esterase
MTVRRCLSVFVMIATIAIGSAAAKDGAGASNNYLALGDSIAFGYIDQARFEYYNPINFVGYPDWTSLPLGLDLANAGCPGESTGSFLSTTAPDLGCRLYRELTHLHVNYGSAPTQFAYATGYLQTHPNTALVTLQLGGNDLGLLEQACHNDPICIANGLPQVLATAAANMGTILAGLRATGYTGPIVVANYYSTDYSNQTTTQLTSALNQAVTSPAPLYGAVVADVFSAFQAAVSNQFAQGKTCVAGLLNAKSSVNTFYVCDVHPSQSGHKLIAQTIAGVYQSRRGKAGK